MEEVWQAVEVFHKDMNSGDVERINAWVSEAFVGYFGYYDDVAYRIYNGEEYREDNIQTFQSYEGKRVEFRYTDMKSSLRKPDELILTATIDFHLDRQLLTTVLAVEVFKKEQAGWMLYRQHMEHFA
ncbi:hypothetical protein JCM19037_307 [Geomicrobium sp. JCM 19037]|uniref:hypothetical protein n=1 Tax=Geomicrobium sp. JCM 19037 TaxID=1460634 RepID=UPI00045F1E38|nr:hypothetical protein [Geomicrobium sp. JCM 19037]GAK02100.1 hypothetical protein JCM19037_307 [Geomicrobium sp. JCM 19037]